MERDNLASTMDNPVKWFHPFWELSLWGFLTDLYGESCDEHERPTKYLIVPLVGMWVWVTGKEN